MRDLWTLSSLDEGGKEGQQPTDCVGVCLGHSYFENTHSIHAGSAFFLNAQQLRTSKVVRM